MVVATADAGEARAAAAANTLWVLDSANDGLEIGSFLRELGDAPTILLLDPGSGAEAVPPAVEHYLTRPFRARTLTVLCEDLLDAIGTTEH